MATTYSRPSTYKATKALAEKFASMKAAPGDRPMSPKRLAFATEVIKSGECIPFVWCSCFCRETGETYRVNGKHTSTAMAQLDGDLKELWLNIIEYEVDTLADVAALYAKFDSSKSGRNPNDINRTFAAAVPELAVIPHRTINVCVAGLSIGTFGVAYRERNDSVTRAGLLHVHPGFPVWFHGLIGTMAGKNRHIYRASVVAAMFMTWQKARGKATEFWGMVNDGSGKHRGPTWILREYLRDSRVLSRGVTAGIKNTDQKAMLVKCIHAWNAWRRDASTDLKYHPTAKIPAVA